MALTPYANKINTLIFVDSLQTNQENKDFCLKNVVTACKLVLTM